MVHTSADGSGSHLDVRALSHIGKSDVGANARRVRDYLARIEVG